MFQAGLLADKIVLVTGGGTGLGRAMGKRFLELGAKLVIASRRADVLEEAATTLSKETGGEVLAVPTDVRDPEAVASLFEQIDARFGRLDVLVNNAAGNFISPTERLSHRAFDTVIGIVLSGTIYCTLEAGKRWIKQAQPGVVLSIVATYAETGSGYVVPSSVAKAGVANLTRSLAAEWGKYRIRLNAIAPGFFPTEGAISRLMPSPEIKALFANRIPAGRVGRHEELSNLASYLISDAADFISGDVITIDGGERAWLGGEFNVLDGVNQESWNSLERARAHQTSANQASANKASKAITEAQGDESDG